MDAFSHDHEPVGDLDHQQSFENGRIFKSGHCYTCTFATCTLGLYFLQVVTTSGGFCSNGDDIVTFAPLLCSFGVVIPYSRYREVCAPGPL